MSTLLHVIPDRAPARATLAQECKRCPRTMCKRCHGTEHEGGCPYASFTVGGKLGLWELALLIQRGLGRVGQSYQFSKRIVFFCKRSLRLGVDDGEYIAAESSPNDQAVIFDGDNPVLLVED